MKHDTTKSGRNFDQRIHRWLWRLSKKSFDANLGLNSLGRLQIPSYKKRDGERYSPRAREMTSGGSQRSVNFHEGLLGGHTTAFGGGGLLTVIPLDVVFTPVGGLAYYILSPLRKGEFLTPLPNKYH